MKIRGIVTQSEASKDGKYYNLSVEGLKLIIDETDKENPPKLNSEIVAIVRTGFGKESHKPYFVLGQWQYTNGL